MIDGGPAFPLPYTLTAGVVATPEGLTGDVERIGRLLDLTPEREMEPPVVPWSDAAEQLRYREGEPWCAEGDYDEIVCVRGSALPPEYALHRLAAILCDDAEAFRVLHWCVTEIGGQDE
jgi:hypothetical protein